MEVGIFLLTGTNSRLLSSLTSTEQTILQLKSVENFARPMKHSLKLYWGGS